jgi:hypothetical protein
LIVLRELSPQKKNANEMNEERIEKEKFYRIAELRSKGRQMSMIEVFELARLSP